MAHKKVILCGLVMVLVIIMVLVPLVAVNFQDSVTTEQGQTDLLTGSGQISPESLRLMAPGEGGSGGGSGGG